MDLVVVRGVAWGDWSGYGQSRSRRARIDSAVSTHSRTIVRGHHRRRQQQHRYAKVCAHRVDRRRARGADTRLSRPPTARAASAGRSSQIWTNGWTRRSYWRRRREARRLTHEMVGSTRGMWTARTSPSARPRHAKKPPLPRDAPLDCLLEKHLCDAAHEIPWADLHPRAELLGRRSSFVNTHYTANASLLGERYRLLQSRAVRYTDHLANLTANLSGPQATQCQRRGCGGYSPCSSDARSERRKPNRTCFARAGW